MNGPGSGVRYWIALVALSVGAAYGIVSVQGVMDDREADRRTIAALADQVRALGGTPVKGSDGKDGVAGKPGRDGRDGEAGRQGVTGAPGAAGRDGAPGAAGKDGAPGKTGPQGAPGADGRPGATGATGPQGGRGERGPQGLPGEKGEQGDPGEPGVVMTCPAGYTSVVVTVPSVEGEYLMCRKEGTSNGRP